MNTNQHPLWLRQLPNAITVMRIALAPAVILILLTSWQQPWGRLLALVLFVVAAATDGLDGGLARRYQIVTNLGKILDPIADKVLLGSALVVLSSIGEVHWAATALILIRELGITAYRLLVARRRVIAANSWGKLKTVFQIIAVAMVIAPFGGFLPFWDLLAQGLIWFSVALTLVTGYTYFRPVSPVDVSNER